MSIQTDLLNLWQDICRAGGTDAYIEKQLVEHGYLVERKDTTSMSKDELKRYKKTLKEEAAQKRKLKKDIWLAYKAAHIVHLGENIYWNDAADADKWDHPKAEERAAENELPKLDSPEQLAEAMKLTMADLRWLAYHREAATSIHYRRFTIPKKNGAERPIWAPLPKLKAAQHWILRNIVERLPVHGSAHGFLPGHSIVTNACIHTDSRTILRLDLKDFFPTVTWRRVKGIFRKAGYREQIATLLAAICTEAPREVVSFEGKTYYVALGPRCLPQGAPTSPTLSNVACMRLDRRLTGLAKKLGWRYSRYADDLTFSLPQECQDKPKLGLLIGSVNRIVAAEGFTVNQKKTHIARKGSAQKVTGLNVNDEGTPRVPREVRRELRAALHNLKQGKPMKEGETLEKLIGYAAFIYMVQPQVGAQMLAEFRKLRK